MLSYLGPPLLCDRKAERHEIEYCAWVVKGSFLLLVAESRLKNVTVSLLGLETTGIHRFLVRDLK